MPRMMRTVKNTLIPINVRFFSAYTPIPERINATANQSKISPPFTLPKIKQL
jgi:hypothetical protein